jgi:phosphatidylethanolamine-binding protein (PEBP) family uncharacterized protein
MSTRRFAIALCVLAKIAISAPTVTSVTPSSGPSTGGTSITITGTGFTGVTDVTVGGNSLGTGGYLVVNATTITLNTPAGVVGPASVVVVSSSGSNPANTLYTYLPAPPSVGGISPNTGSTAGGTKVTIVGAGFTGVTAVTIGGVPATGVTAKGDTQISATTGAGASGNASVAVTTPNGTSYPNKLFTYVTPGSILYTQVLGQPTDHNATINIQANAALDISYRYGTASGTYSATTGVVTATADPYTAGAYVAQVVLNGLQPNSAYYYQIQYRPAGSGAPFTVGTERSFHTQRAPGSTFVFTVQGDSHPERVLKMFHADLYNKTLSAAAADNPDFHITSGDDFSVDTIGAPYTQSAVVGRYTLQLPYFNLLNTSALFLGTGNHEETSLFNYNLPADPTNKSDQVATWAQNARNLYYPSPGPNDPITGSFYTGNLTQLPNINGYLRDYYAWTWGDALFVVIDPYWGSPAMVDTPLGANTSGVSKNSNEWAKTHGNAQYQWLAQTLQNSKAKWKFVFAHHVMGTGRGGVEVVPLYEWGGLTSLGGPSAFAANRQPFNDGTSVYSWPEPIHKLFVDNNVTIFFGAHDHIYVHQQLDGVHYQALPNPGDNTYTAFNADAYVQPGQSLYPDAGYVRVTVGPTGVKVDYVREFLPQDETATLKSGMIQDSYTIGAAVTPPPVCNYALSLSGQGFSSSGGAGTVGVTAGAGCAWSVSGVPGWLTLSSGGSGTGNGTVSYQVLANSGAGRSAVMTVGGVGFTVEQTAGAGAIAGLSAVGSLAQVNSQGGWSFELDAVNVGSSPATARISFTDPSGNALPMPLTFPQQAATGAPELASTLDRTINANGRLVVISSGPVASPALLGSGQLWSNGSVSGFGTFSFPALQWNAVVPLETRNASKYSLPFDNTSPLHTGVALSNITTSAVSVSVTILNDAGTQIRTDTINLPAQGYQQFLLDTQYTQTAGARGTIQFSTAGSGQISVLGVRANGAALTTLPVLSNVDPAGGSISDVTYNGGFTSTFYLVNTGTNAASFTLSFYNQTGAAANVPLVLPQTGETLTTTGLTRTLAAGQMLEVATQANDGAANISGSAQLTGNVSGFEIFRWNTYGQEASVPLETRTPGSFALVFDNTSPLNTGVSLTNASSAAANITANVYDDQGNSLGSGLVSLAGRGQQVFMLPDKFPITAGKRGMVQFVVPTSGPISMIGIRTSGTTLTTVPILTMAATGPVITGTVPDAPANLSATPGNTTASIAFTAPANGGLPITSYIAACVGGGATFTGVATASPVVVTGLTNGTAYSCTVAATNAAGTGNPSASVSVTPVGVINTGSFVLTSSAGVNNGALPAAYTCDGTGSTPPLAWSGAPAGTTEYAILLSTIPAPGQLKYDWVLYHIPGTVSSLAKDSFLVGTVGVGDDGPGTTYDPPCSSGPGAKTYTITIYALSAAPTFSVPANQVTGTMVASAIAPLTLGTAQLNLNYTRFPTASGSNPQSPGYSPSCLYIRFSLQAAKDGVTSIGCDGTYAYISSIGMPIGSASDTMMTGITGTNLQVPTPTDFLGANGWKIPMNAVYNPNSATPVPSGPIGVAINGVPIFNPCVQNGCNATSGDTKALGQLDVCNGHAGRADDYHYHAAPNCMMAEQSTAYWNTHPVGWLLDGFALFGYQNADGSTPVKDSCGIAPMSGQAATLGGNTYPYTFAYHVQDTYPYITNNCVSGVPSPDLPNQASKYRPFRQPPVTPFTDSAMTLTTDATDGYQVLQFSSANPFTTTENGQDSYSNLPGTYKIRYKQVTGADLAALLALKQNANATACWNFQFVDSTGKTTQPSVSYCKNNP